MSDPRLDELVVNTLKTLAIDAVERANSGHPGMPMGMADTASVLWRQFLVVDPADPGFADRDRFILSAGHGSMLLYGLLHLSGFDLSMDELQRFRQLGSKTPGHPEVGLTPGVETTTGPLGQGFANGVGLALAEAHLAARFNRPGLTLVDHFTYAICSDGDLHEGLSHEAAAIAGHLGLGKLVYLFDDNSITIDGATDLSTSEDVTGRFEAYGWHVLAVDGHDRAAVAQAIAAAQAVTDKPSLIRCKTRIGAGSPNRGGTSKSHGSPLGKEETRLTKEALGWPVDAEFLVPAGVREAFAELRRRGAEKRAAWHDTFARYQAAHPELAAEWRRIHDGAGLPGDVQAHLPTWAADAKPEATRVSSGKVINALAPHVTQLMGGSADLAGSNNTTLKDIPFVRRGDYQGRNVHFGVREHAMAAILNGLALHGGVIPYAGTFLTFSDYMRPSIRLAALMHQRVVHVLTHDSIFLGEDGPTHQSIEHAMALRLIPGLHVMRPADGRETAAAWLAALRRTDGPTAMLLTRQNLPQLPGSESAVEGVAKGGYVVHGDPDARPDVILIATGSEVHLCTQAAAILEGRGLSVRVVSMPCVERFMAQPEVYRLAVLPPECPIRLSVEAGRTLGWERFVGPLGASIGIDRFGESAPAEDLATFFGLTVDNVVNQALGLLGTARQRARDQRALLDHLVGGP